MQKMTRKQIIALISKALNAGRYKALKDPQVLGIYLSAEDLGVDDLAKVLGEEAFKLKGQGYDKYLVDWGDEIEFDFVTPEGKVWWLYCYQTIKGGEKRIFVKRVT